MKPFVHINATTVEQAIDALETYNGQACLNAGGSDLFGLLKDEFLPQHPKAIINLKTISGLDYIQEEDGLLRIGALARLSELANAPIVRQRFGALAEAAHGIASPQIRNMATVGGNLCQDVRCCYYRYPRHVGGPIACARKNNSPCLAVSGDNRYHALLEGRKCFAVCPSDLAVALAAFDAQLLVAGPEGERRIAVRDFFTPLGNRLEKNEMVKEIEVPTPSETTRQSFDKFTLRKPIDFAIVSVASVLTVEEGICRDARIALGGVAPGPYRAVAAEDFLRGEPINAESAAKAGELALEGARPLSQNGYKVEIAKTLVKRAIFNDPSEERK